MKDKKMKVVVVGGGFGGVKTALELANKQGIEVTLIAPTSNFEYHGALYRSATGKSPLEVAIRIHDILNHARNVTFVLDSISGFLPQKNVVVGIDGDMYEYDYLVLAMGNQVNYFGIEGMNEHASCMITVPAAIELRSKIVALTRSLEKNPSVVIVGAGPTGTELAGDIQTFSDLITRKNSLPRKNFKVHLVEGGIRVLPTLHEKLSVKALARLQKLDVIVHLSSKVIGCKKDGLVLESGLLAADLVVWTAGSKPVDFYVNNEVYFELVKGRVVVDEYLRAKGHENVFVLGDNAATKYTGMAQTALHDALFVTRNLQRIKSNQDVTTYRARVPIYVVPIGPRWAVLQTKKSLLTGYKAWLVRRRADLWIFKNFEPYKKAVKQWRSGNRTAQF